MKGVSQMERTRSSIMADIRQQVRDRLSIKYNWKRIPHGSIEKLQNRIGRAVFPQSAIRRYSGNQEVDLGTDETGRDVASGLKEYEHLLLSRNVQLHTLIVLGSRVKGRGKAGSDIDVTVIASNLPGRSSPEFSNIPRKILNIRRWLLLNDAPILMGIQPSLCCSKEEFLRWLSEFRLIVLDAICYGKILYDDGFWKEVLAEFREIEDKYGLNMMEIKTLLVSL